MSTSFTPEGLFQKEYIIEIRPPPSPVPPPPNLKLFRSTDKFLGTVESRILK